MLRPWWQATVAVLPAFLMTRVIFLLLSYIGGVLFSAPVNSPLPLSYHDIIYNWDHGDTLQYLVIATQGYISAHYTYFFPLYPTLVHTLSTLVHRDALTTGLLLSNIIFLGTLTVFYRFVEMEFDSDTAQRTVLYLAIFPTAFFFFAATNQSLLLFFVLLCFYALRRRYWWFAGLFGALATLTSVTGIFLLAVFIYEFVRYAFTLLQQQSDTEQTGQMKRVNYYIHLLVNGVAALLIPLGLDVYTYGLKVSFGDPFAFWHAQSYWTAGVRPPWVAPLLTLKDVLHLPHFLFIIPHDIIDLAILCLFLILLVLCFVGPERLHRNQWSFALFGLLVLLYGLLFPSLPGTGGLPYDPLLPLEGFILSIFPAFIILARIGRRTRFHRGYLLLALPLLACFTLLFITGRWVA